MTKAEHTQVVSNVKFLFETEGALIAKYYQNGKIIKADNKLNSLYIVKQYSDTLCAYDPDKANNWVTDDEADVLVDFLQAHFKSCNLKEDVLALPVESTAGYAIYSDGTFIELSNGSNLNYS